MLECILGLICVAGLYLQSAEAAGLAGVRLRQEDGVLVICVLSTT